ncbi:MAG: cysteine hydrolase [Clostridia bacterium]|nr:cysteine hydrolase [Clostridia bacterium]
MKLIVVDMQKALMDDELYNFEGLVENVRKLIETARESGVEVIYVQHDAGEGTGFSVGDEAFEIADEVAPREGEKVFVKKINSCFGNKEFAAYLEDAKDEALMIIGLQTNFCIDATVKSAFERGYDVIIPEGSNSTFDNPYMNGETTCAYYFNEVWPDLFADCVTMDEAVTALKTGELPE